MTPPNTVFDTAGDAFSSTIGELFDIPETNLDGQLLEMTNGDASYQSYQETPIENDPGTNATAHDDGLDAALIDLLPFP